jgi:predicted kinase
LTLPDPPLLVVVSGPAAAGKSTIARALADELSLPLLAKDDIKETLYDMIGTGDRAWSQMLGRATFEVQLRLAAELLRGGCAFVLEGNFAAEFDPVSRLPPHRPVQVYCTAARETLLERYETRERHPGHVDHVVLQELRAGEHDHRTYRLDVAATFEIDTTSGSVDVPALAAAIGKMR